MTAPRTYLLVRESLPLPGALAHAVVDGQAGSCQDAFCGFAPTVRWSRVLVEDLQRVLVCPACRRLTVAARCINAETEITVGSCAHSSPACDDCIAHDTLLHMST